jgi:integrase
MENPTLGEVDGAMMLRYRERLRTLPIDVYQTRRRYGARSLADLVGLVKVHSLPTMSAARASAYIAKIGEAFAWGVRRGFMTANPTAGMQQRKKRLAREQDERDIFTEADLQAIFSAPWFRAGTGEKTASGDYRQFQPHYYWLPLLGLYTGGRLNELCQLHLKDIQCTTSGLWFLDFNLIGSGTIDEPDKRLKTVNAEQVVPVHPELIRLGFTHYVDALKGAGYDRLFPELRFDEVKGYGKQAGQWFNERFLGVKLGIPRDGRRTYHSFRHMTITWLYNAETPETVVSQLSGHERGKTLSAQRYKKTPRPTS